MGAIITLTTDFGLTDGYVADMKGVVLGINPDANLVDICHTIEPQNVSQAAFVLSTVYEYFPSGTVHLVVVDPGVGTERQAIILRTPEACFVAPDNGVLSYILQRCSPEGFSGSRHRLEPDSELTVIAITDSKFWHSPVSPTFHGRDIFAPVAACLSLGVAPDTFGEKIDSLAVLNLTHPELKKDGTLVGHVLHIDNFGNLITNIRNSDLSQDAADLTVSVANKEIRGLNITYGTGQGLLALIGSSDHLEIALRDGNAAAFTGARVGDEVKIRKINL